ncbi:trypsin-like peptidase domain-containing protein [Amycolatopsis sp. SID8362]|uniref:S1C family serine protease n=1 Tax=Amycolatopsis sp. SID8362 TaxID=2690346 RepID=UPI00136FE365|nr:trypsin-like peptidase domain-containing protein [Amycolatopsis sp. SID8362]NBH07745.1 trypsin-like serine protease [Amycolatopsis sp. SID8362]NED44440.1 trypsin-like serine protease [Amycolatopsis sp. SID8362]
MTENESRPGPASPGGHQPHQSTPQYGPYAQQQYGYQHQAAPNPLFTPQQPGPAPTALKTKPRKGGRVALIVSATALGAALVGGVGGAAIVGLGTNSADGTTTSVSTPAASGQPVANSTSGDVSGVAAKVTPSVVQINVTTDQGEAIGSGVILTSDGRILTNAHVVDGAQDVVITTSDGKKYQASVVGADTKADIAVVQAKNASGLTAATLGDSSKLVVGQSVVAIGSPGGLQNTVTTGIVSALNRNLSDIGEGQQHQQSPFSRTSNQAENSPSYTAIQTDASINQGNSGGALVDAQGNVIGINSALYSPAASANGSAGSVGIGFAIPINDAKKIVDQIVNN